MEERKEEMKDGRERGKAGRVKAEREGWRGEGGRKQRGVRCGERRDSERNGRIFHTPRSHIIFFFSFHISS